MKDIENKKKKAKKSNQRVKMRSLDEANMKMALKDEADGIRNKHKRDESNT